jgi:transposase
MSRFRLLPTPAQQAVLRDHCGHARYVWNLAVEQHAHWRPGRKGAPGYREQCRQLTAARAEHPWLAAGSQTVQQQALRDFARAMTAFFDPANPAGRPSWRKAGRHEGFGIVGRGRQWDVRRVSRKVGQVWVPKAGWVRFRWSRAVPPDVKSYRVTMDRAGRWHVAFAVIPGPVPAPGNGRAVGIDRGVAVAAALSTGELLHCSALTGRERTRLRRLQRRLARARRGSNRGILGSGWGLLVRRLHDKVPGRVEKVKPHFTSQRCSACGQVDGNSRESQARFVCTACGFACHADVNAAINIAAGHAVTARGGFWDAGPVNREPQLLASLAGRG